MITQPESLPMLVEIVRGAAEDKLVLRVEGGCTKIGWLFDRNPPIDLPIDMTHLSGIISHDHGDMTATVRAGTRLAELQTAVAERGQRLAIDPPLGRGQQATLGGIFSANDAGPGRLSYGSLRELCIGASFVLADGTVAKSGSKVIKNVAGYDLCKLLCGARGTLAIVGQLTVRLHPMPAAEVTVRATMTASTAARGSSKLTGTLTPDGVTYCSDHEPDPGALWVRFTGPAGLVSSMSASAKRQFEDLGGSDIETLDGDDSRSAWAEATERRMAREGETSVAVTVPRTQFGEFAKALSEWAATEPGRLRLVADPPLGTVLVMIAPAPEPEPTDTADADRAPAPDLEARRHATVVGHIRRLVHMYRGHVRLRDHVPRVAQYVDPFGTLPGGASVMARVKAALDPDGRLAPGRFLTNP